MNAKNDLPAGWADSQLADLVDRLQYGYTASASSEIDGPRFLRITDISEDGVDWSTVPSCEISKSDFDKYRLNEGDIVFARTGSIEKAWRVSQPPDAVFASYLIRGRPLVSETSNWLQQFVRSPRYLRQIGAAGAGIGRQNVNAKKLGAIKLPVPPLNEQRRIVAKIEELSARSRRAREALEVVPPLLERLRQSVLAAAFSGRLTADWRDKNNDVEPASVLLERIRAERRRRWEDNELAKLRAKGKEPKDDHWKAKYKEPEPVDPTGLPELPEGWCAINGEWLFSWASGKFLPSSSQAGGDVPVYGGNGINGLHDVPLTTEPCLVVGRVGANCGNVHLTKGPAWVTDNAIYSTWVSPMVCVDYVHMLLDSATLNQRSRGGGQPYVNQAALNNTILPIPPIEEQRAITATISQMVSIAATSMERLGDISAQLEELGQSILAKAFRGELVPQDPNDEPASVLLERIRAQHAAAEADTKKRKSSRPLRLCGEKQDRKDAKSATNPTTDHDPLQTVLLFLQTNPGPHSKSDILTHTNLDPTTWSTLAPQLNSDSRIHLTGQMCGTKYVWKSGH